MRKILVLGAGRSSTSLIHYLVERARTHEWTVTVGDLSESAAIQAVGASDVARGIHFDINDAAARETIAAADVVISLLPAFLHPKVAEICLEERKHLLTASYVSDVMVSYHSQAVGSDLLFVNECGLDPGIDHMSAMRVIDRIHDAGGRVTSFESFTGGLLDPASDPENPWKYKFTWNPRNVVMAGQSIARFLRDGELKFIPYHQLFRRPSHVVFPDGEKYEGYANRDSLKYIEIYGLEGVETMLRGTLRYEGFCEAWNVFVQLGCCDDTVLIEDVSNMTHRDFINAFLDGKGERHDFVARVSAAVGTLSEESIQKLKWSGFFDDEPVGLKQGTPAQILEHILNKRWKLNQSDRDLVVMQHRFSYELDGSVRKINSSLVTRGDNGAATAMAKTVGLPLAIAAKLLLTGKITRRGVAIPTTPEFYEPILKELGEQGVTLSEEEV